MEEQKAREGKKRTEARGKTAYLVKREFKNTVDTGEALERLVRSHIK